MTTFISYASSDGAFARQLAGDLRRRGVQVWIAELDIPKGSRWDREVQSALQRCSQLALVVSPATEQSENVLDEVAFALDSRRPIIPLLVQPCRKPFRVARLQHVDFSSDYQTALTELEAAIRGQLLAEASNTPVQARVFLSCTWHKDSAIRDTAAKVVAEYGLAPVELEVPSGVGPVREVLVQLISTCDFFLGVLSASNKEDLSPWRLWELGVATAMGKPAQLLISGVAARDLALRLYPDRLLHEFSDANLEQVVRTAVEQISALPKRKGQKGDA